MTEDNKLLKERVEKLEASLAELRDEFLTKAQTLKIELGSVRKLIEQNNEQTIPEAISTPAPYVWQENSADSLVIESHKAEIISDQSAIEQNNKPTTDQPPLSSETSEDAWASLELGSDSVFKPARKETQIIDQPAASEAREPGFVELFIANSFNSILGYLLNTLTMFKAPFQELFHRLFKLYAHYQEQGKAPVFLMTVAGLITLTFGFAYLLQFSFNSLFNDTLKAITGFVIGAAIIGAGILLSVKKTGFRDYAASVIALGVIFNYLTAYFIGPYYALVTETTGFILLLGVTAISFWLAIVFETRIVAAVTLVGGMFMPLIVGDVESVGMAFLMYLLVLSSANLYLSHRIKWPALSQLSFLLSLSVIEYAGISEALFPVASVALLSAFFYLYTYYWTFDGVALKESLSKHDLAILVANVFYFIYAMLSISAEPLLLAGVLAAHAIVLSFIVKILRLMKSIMAPMYLLFIGLLIATAVFVLSPADVTSIIWAVEGLAMLYIGFRYTHKLIRAEGYAIYVIAMASLLWQAVNAFIDKYITVNPDPSAIAWHWINLVAFGILSMVAYRIIYRFKDDATPTEHKAAFVQNEIFTLWGAIALSLVMGLFLPAFMTVLAVIPMLWCFFRVSRHKLRFAQLTGFIFFAAFIAQIIVGVFDSNSTVLSEQSYISHIALLELLFFAWVLHFYYQHFELTGRAKSFATKIHQLSFYAPAFLVILSLYNIFDRHIDGYYPLVFGSIWIDFSIIGLLLYVAFQLVNKTEKPEGNIIRTRHAYLLSETLSLFISAFFLYSISLLNFEWMFTAAVMPMFYLLYRGLKQDLPHTEKLAWAHFILSGVSVLLSYQTVGNFHFSEQPWSTRIVLVELLLSAWAMQMIYERLSYQQGWYPLATKLRLFVYCLIPLLFLPRILRLYPDYLAVALWASFTISWLMYKKLQIVVLLKELSLLFYIAIIATVMVSLSAMTGAKELPGLVALITGLLVVSTFHVIEKTLSSKNIRQSPYHFLQISSPYFYAFIIAGLSYALSHQITVAVMVTGLYFLFITRERRVQIVMHESLTLSYALTWLGLTAVPLMVFSQAFQQNLLLSNTLVSIVTSLISVSGIWFLTHRQTPVFKLFTQKYFEKNSQYWIFHGVVVITYIGLLNLIFSPWAVAMSIAMLIHAVFILFLTLSEQYKGLLRLSIALYAVTAIKVLLHDMNDFGNLHKVFALMGIGSILMVAAFMFQKMRGRQV